EIVGEAFCAALAPKTQFEAGVHVYVHIGDKTAYSIYFDSPEFRVPLPPGDYNFRVCGDSTLMARRAVRVKSEPRVQPIEPFELRATPLALLTGKPAPELTGVLAWKDNKPVRLSELRGKCVLLAFIQDLDYEGRPTQLMNFYNKYHEVGLEVVGLHVAVPPYERDPQTMLSAELAKLSKDFFKGGTVAFPVALLSGERTSFGTDSDDIAIGPTRASYFESYSTCYVLIDRQGNVVGQVHDDERGVPRLEQALQAR